MASEKNELAQKPASAGPLGISVAWGYGFAALLIFFIFTILVPDADGPSPWDPVAFRKGMLEMIANFRILDEMADLSIVKVADVGEGWLIVDLDLIGVSNRKFGYAPFYMALACTSLCLLLRAIRQRLLASYFGIPSSVKGQLSAFWFGRGLNLFFPFGPGEQGTIQTLVENGAQPKAASTAVFYNRVFEIIGITFFLGLGFFYLGWGGAVEAFFWSLVLLTGLVSLTRPMGRGGKQKGIFRNIWAAFKGETLLKAINEMLQTPKFFIGMVLLSIAAMGLEIFGYWSIKQAFSSPMDDYILMKDLQFVSFMICITIASLTRVIPYTFASFGIYEFAAVVMFRIFDQGFLGGTTVALLDSLLINGMTLVFFLLALIIGKCPSILETWRNFFDQSAARSQSGSLPAM